MPLSACHSCSLAALAAACANEPRTARDLLKQLDRETDPQRADRARRALPRGARRQPHRRPERPPDLLREGRPDGPRAAHRRRLQRLGHDARRATTRRPARRRASKARRGRTSRAPPSRTRASNTSSSTRRTRHPTRATHARSAPSPASAPRSACPSSPRIPRSMVPRRRQTGTVTEEVVREPRAEGLAPRVDLRAGRLRGVAGHLSDGLLPRRRQLRRLDGRAVGARPADCRQRRFRRSSRCSWSPAAARRSIRASPAWRAFIATELVPIDRREAADVSGARTTAHLRQFARRLRRRRSGRRASRTSSGCAPPSRRRPRPPHSSPTRPQGQRAIHGVRFFVLGAVYDTDVKGARTLRTALAEASADVTYEEVPEGHAAETFRTHIDNALKALLPAAGLLMRAGSGRRVAALRAAAPRRRSTRCGRGPAARPPADSCRSPPSGHRRS